MDEERIYTLAEAQSLLPRLRTLLEDLGREWKRISDLNPEIQKARDKASLNGYSKFGVEYIESVSHLMSLIHEIKDMGVLLKDADKGLCDFPYIKDGKIGRASCRERTEI